MSYGYDDAGNGTSLTLTGTSDYDASGAVRSQTGTSLSLDFTGELTDPSTGLVGLRARKLDPTLDRFLSADTVQPNAPGSQGYNLYAYVANNPTSWVDPSGYSTTGNAAGTAGTAAAMSILSLLMFTSVLSETPPLPSLAQSHISIAAVT
ncbi:MAG: RHS repeat-associated core domain-containing protein [Nitrolancea sp.]